ncbi:MAG TPA: hypothetical protein VF691_03465 [Cytophagaceae bacterium]|jgi:hypothetical protein
MKTNFVIGRIALMSLAIIFLFSSCKKDDSSAPSANQNNAARGTVSYKRDGQLITASQPVILTSTYDQLLKPSDISPNGNYYSWMSKSNDTLKSFCLGVIKPNSATDTTSISILLFSNTPVLLANKTFTMSKFSFPYSSANGQVIATAFSGSTSETGPKSSTSDVTSLTGTITFAEVNEVSFKASGTFSFDIAIKRRDNGKIVSYKITEGQFNDISFQKF